MSPALHRTKELFERWTGRHLVRKNDFPYLTAEKRFLKVRLDLHNKCNIRCRMCYFALDEVWKQPRVDMSDKVIDRMESEIWPRTHRLALSCATEPLISRKLGPVLTRAKRAGVPFVQIITNGEHSFIADEPARRGGDNLGPNPFSLLLAALGS